MISISQYNLPWSYTWRIIAVAGFLLFLAGTTFGYPSLYELYLQAHVFEAACSPQQIANVTLPITQPVCDEQGALMDSLLITGAASADLLGPFLSLAIPVVTKQFSLQISAAFIFIGLLIIGITASYATFLELAAQGFLLHSGFLLTGLGQSVLLNVALSYAYNVRDIASTAIAALHPYVTGLQCSAYALSAITPLWLGAVAKQSGAGVILPYAVLVCCAALLFLFSFWADMEDVKVSTPEKPFVSRVKGVLQHFPLVTQPIVYTSWAYTMVAVVWMNWYQSTVNGQISYVSGNSDTTNTLQFSFYIVLPVTGAIGNVFFSWLLRSSADSNGSPQHYSTHNSYTSWRGFNIMLFMLVFWGISSCISNGWLQMATFIVFGLWRVGVFTTFYHHIIERQPANAILLLINGQSFFAGLLSFLNNAIRVAITNHGPGAYPIINAAFLVVTTIFCAIIMWISKKQSTFRQNEQAILLQDAALLSHREAITP